MFKVSNEILYQILDLGERLYSSPGPTKSEWIIISVLTSSLLYAKHCCKWIDYLS